MNAHPPTTPLTQIGQQKDSRELKADMRQDIRFIHASKMKKGQQLATLLFKEAYDQGKYLLKCDIKNAFPSISKDLIRIYLGPELKKCGNFSNNCIGI